MRLFQLVRLRPRSSVRPIAQTRCVYLERQRFSSTISDSPITPSDGSEPGDAAKQHGDGSEPSNVAEQHGDGLEPGDMAKPNGDGLQPGDVAEQHGDGKDASSQRTPKIRRRGVPLWGDPLYKTPKVDKWHHIDTFHMGPAKQLIRLLNDLMPDSSRPVDELKPDSVMPQYAYLAYFPIRDTPSELAPDGAEAKHVPVGFDLTQPKAMRVWAGGTLSFATNWYKHLRFFQPYWGYMAFQWFCLEKFGHVSTRRHYEDAMAIVELQRRYGPMSGQYMYTPPQHEDEVTDWPLRETRQLAFVTSFEEKPDDILPPPGRPSFTYKFRPTPEHLFQFSALTNNAHYIHLDREKGLVHGPLTLALMLRAIEHALCDKKLKTENLMEFSYRNLRPLYVGEEATVCLRQRNVKDVVERARKSGPRTWVISTWDVWIEKPDGGMAVRATAQVRRNRHRSALPTSREGPQFAGREVPGTEPAEAAKTKPTAMVLDWDELPEYDEPAESEPAEAEAEAAKTESAENEPAEAEADVTRTKFAESEAAKTEPAKPEPAKPEPAKPEPAEVEAAETEAEVTKTESVENEPAKTEPAEHEPAETESSGAKPAEGNGPKA